MVAPFPQADESLFDTEAEAEMAVLMEAVRSIRNMRKEVGIAPSRAVNIIAFSENAKARQRIQDSAEGIKFLARVGEIEAVSLPPQKEKYVAAHIPEIDLYMEVGGVLDVAKELARIDAELASVEKELGRTRGKLSNDQFLSRAPAKVVEKERRVAAELEDKKARLLERRRMLEG